MKSSMANNHFEQFIWTTWCSRQPENVVLIQLRRKR